MKKTISILLSVIMLISVIATSTVSVSADINLNDYENYRINSNVSSIITENSDGNVYKFTISSSGKVNLNFTGYLEWIYINIYDINGNELYGNNPHWNSNLKVIRVNEDLYLDKGQYYISFQRDGSRTGEYEFILRFYSSGESFTETISNNNDEVLHANSIKIGSTYKGVITKRDSADNYIFKLSNASKIKLNFTSYMEWVYVRIYDINGNELYGKNPRWNDATKRASISEYITLSAGTYFLSISKDGRTGNYNFKLSYTVSKPGTPSVSISKGKSIFRWAKAAGVSGYQLEISRYSNFKKISVKKTQSSNKYTKTLSRNTKYYVRVRSYKKIGSKTYYSSWATKSFKTK